MHLQTMRKGDSSNIDCDLLWKTIWAMPVTNAFKVFMWHACTNLLPTKQTLLKRNDVVDPNCPICLREDETLGHVLWYCPAASDVWILGNKAIQKASIIDTEFG